MAFSLKKSPKSRAECLSYFDNCKENILQEACIISQENIHAPIVEQRQSDCDIFQCVITSTPNCKTGETKKKSFKSIKQDELFQNKNLENSDNSKLSVSKVLHMVEMKRKEEALYKRKSVIIAREEQLEKDRAAYRAQFEAKVQAKDQKIKEEQLKTLKEEENLAAERKQRQELEQQRYAQRASMRDEQIKAAELLKKEAEAERKKKAAATLKCAEELQAQLRLFSEVYNKIHQEFKACQALAPLVSEAKPLNLNMLSLVQRLKSCDVNQKDVDNAIHNYSKINAIYANVLEEAAKIKKQSEENEVIKKQEDNKVHTQSTQLQHGNIASSEAIEKSSPVTGLSDCSDKESLQWYLELKKIKNENEKVFETLLKDDRLKKFRFDCQKAVNIPVNAISPVNASHLRDKFQKLSLLLSGQPVSIADGVRVSASQHPAGIPFCKDLLAKKFVRQGASTVSSKPEAAFAIAAVMVALWQEFPDWGQLLLAHFHLECPYLVPIFWPQLEGQSNKEYYLSLGYIYNEDGEVEKQDKFLKRMSGIMRLYAALLITCPPREKTNRPHPHDLGQGWRWLSSLLNLEPRPDICASLLYDFLEVTGSSMLEQYGRQYQKLLLVICKGYFPRLQRIAVSSSGPVVRLETFLQTILKHGSKPPQGMLPLNFW
ncbi:Nucleoporin GLE1 [Frankliniella fusca]|uniref:mRNA export factor GLE1 n=1 Tax=Frankliniella fusca TaxID=407009 RepID=A0AAE1I246_9NEOP|nr:Nucleoporin GLE1 [Frankliniella fusca]